MPDGQTADGQTAGPPNTKTLEVRRLTCGYGGRPVIFGVDLRVRGGECLAVLGSNGAGKSTLIRSIAGTLRPVLGGEVTVAGVQLARAGAAEVVRHAVRLVPEGRRLFPTMTVEENIELGGFTLRSKRDRGRRLAETLEAFPRLAERRRQLVGTLSGGERQMTAIARALMTDPDFLLLDEPSLGLAPKILLEIGELITGLKARGTGVVLVEQSVGLAELLAERYLLLSKGAVVARGDIADMADRTSMADAYLGQTAVSAAAHHPDRAADDPSSAGHDNPPPGGEHADLP
ncbi:ABC transporter ATP-binding protein [Acrocarpospora catenulata]|uniref:ABC transporter ATP-binding protein n=1 Tax=Acrocarpospora catenulata TaxID=2836182 RepID=UPI001BDB2795|nr:ABC transporter ATP-binding protein [Acrocarpospora catenulata]